MTDDISDIVDDLRSLANKYQRSWTPDLRQRHRAARSTDGPHLPCWRAWRNATDAVLKGGNIVTPQHQDAHHHWRCPKCHETYESPIPVIAVRCGNHHGRNVDMKPELND